MVGMKRLLLGLALCACDPASMPDAGAVDAGPLRMDAASGDAGAADAGGMDAALADAGRDAGAVDAGTPGDGGVPCSVSGVMGTCLHVDDCIGENRSTPGFCPGPAEIQCCTPTSGSMCDPSVMPTPNDGLSEAPGMGGCPDGMVPIADFCIDRYEASLELVGGGTWSPFHNPGDAPVRAVSIEGAIPQGYITGRQAAAACEAAGKRLCTDDEWLRACRGAGLANTYPYGNTRMPGVCNDARSPHPAYERFGTTEDWVFSMLGDACISQLPDSLDPTGDNPGCVTDEGVFDLMGNLHEWTADPAGTFRGGYYVDTVINGNGCLYRTTAHSMGHWDYSTGFRCCAD